MWSRTGIVIGNKLDYLALIDTWSVVDPPTANSSSLEQPQMVPPLRHTCMETTRPLQNLSHRHF
jgi:hypothetical protein